MDPNRAAKRRKLDPELRDSQKSSPAAHNRSTPITYAKKNGTELQDSNAAVPSNTAPSSAHLAWQEAKAKSQALRRKRVTNVEKEKPVDIYDDIDGAHNVRPPGKYQPQSSTPVKKQLDPLRNQKAGTSSTSSPSKRGASLGFFKQYATPKSKLQDTAPRSDAVLEKQANGVHRLPNGASEEDAISGAEVQVDEPDQEEQDLEAPGKGVWKGWAYQTAPKKTLEDEIRELGNVAREQAEKYDDGGPADAVSSSRRKRKPVNKVSVSEGAPTSSSQPKPATNKAPKKRNLADQLKQARPDIREPPEEAEIGAEEAMDIVEPDAIQPGQQSRSSSTADRKQDNDSTKLVPQRRSKPSHSAEVTFSAEHVQQIQSILLEKLTRRRRTQLSNLDTEYKKVSNLVKQTITAGESNSMLLIGARGSGKSALIDQILHEQSQKHTEDFHVVRLNGFIHTDDKIALREIWRQLGREMELEGDDNVSKNYADTLTTLLALLSHPTELGQEQHADQITKSVIFIIDEFDLFANHPRQTLLYNLFDIAQSRKAPIAMLGLTTRIDVAESLEKRVKSRFSHRYVYIGFSKSFTTFQDACKASVSLHFDELSTEEREALGAKTQVTEKLAKQSKKKKSESVIAHWNDFIDDLLEDAIFTTHLRRTYYTTKSVPEFHSSMLLPVSCLSTESSSTASDLLSHFTEAFATTSLAPPDSNISLSHSLSTLHLALLICAARLTNIHAIDVVPFAQAYEEYKVLASKQKLQASASGALAQGAGSRVWSKDVAKGAWEDLITFGLAIEDGNRGVRVDVGLEEIGMSGADLGSWARWCREI